MEYDEQADCYYCKNGQDLTVQYEKKKRRPAVIGGPLPYIKVADALSKQSVSKRIGIQTISVSLEGNCNPQSILVAIGYNINKLHHKIQAERTGQHLFSLKKTP